MRSRSLVAIAVLAVSAAGCPSTSTTTVEESGGWSATDLSGPWLLDVPGVPSAHLMYLLPDGVATVTDVGAFNVPTPAATYTVTATGSVHVAFPAHGGDPAREFAGAFVSTVAVSGTVDGQPASLRKVLDPGACAGDWAGTISEVHPGGEGRRTLRVTVAASGAITAGSITGKATAVSGRRLFCEGDRLTGFATTDAGGSDPYNQLQFVATTTGHTAIGSYYADGNPVDGTFWMMRPVTDGTQNARFTGPWLMDVSGAPSAHLMYVLPDGVGTVSEVGAFNEPFPAGSYGAYADGSLRMVVDGHGADPAMELAGTFLTTTHLTGAIGTLSIDLRKVADPSACAGTWTGTLSETAPGTASWPSTLTVDSTGAITGGSITGKATTFSGARLYCDGGKLVAFAKTNAPDGYRQVQLAGDVSGDVVSGSYHGDGNPLEGTFTLSR